MFTENDIRHEMQRLDVQSGIDTSKIPIRISTRMTSTWGKCVYNLSKGKVKEFVFGDRLLRYPDSRRVFGLSISEFIA